MKLCKDLSSQQSFLSISYVMLGYLPLSKLFIYLHYFSSVLIMSYPVYPYPLEQPLQSQNLVTGAFI